MYYFGVWYKKIEIQNMCNGSLTHTSEHISSQSLSSARFLSLPSGSATKTKISTKMSSETEAISAVAAMGVPNKTPEGSRESSSAGGKEDAERTQYVVYPRRWAVLVTVALLNISNAAVRSFSSCSVNGF